MVTNQIKSTLIIVAIGTLLTTISSCGTQSTNEISDRPSNSPSSIVPSSTSNTTTSQPLTTSSTSTPTSDSSDTDTPSQPTAPDTVSVTIYKADSQCANLIPEKVELSSDRPIDAAVGKVIEEQSSADFQLTGYRVNLGTNGVATVDLRLAPNSQRRIPSLSTCEQFALFGSLRETLTKNPEWDITSVRFTERGKEIVF